MVVITSCDNMFWGVTIDAGKRYSQVVKQGFHVSMAALEAQAKKPSENVQVMLQHESSEYLLCTLHSNLFQQPLDLNFVTGEQVAFSLNGSGVVHLTGYLIPDEEPDFEEESFSESEEEDEDVPFLVESSEADKKGGKRKVAVPTKVSKKIKLSDSVDNDEDDDEDDEDSEEEEGFSDDFEDEFEDEEFVDDDDDEDADISLKNKGQNKTLAKLSESSPKKSEKTPQQGKKAAGDAKSPKQAGETPKTSNGAQTPKTDSTPGSEESSKKKKKKKKKKKNKEGNVSQNDSLASTSGTTPKSEQTTPKTEPTPKKRVVAGGTVVEDLKVGHGPEAKPGKMASVYYVGTLAKSNKQFDSRTDGKPFRFRLNQGEVIKGWDNGVLGMKVGGKRRISVPASQGYGNAKQGPIPPNSALVFEVELKAVS